MKNSKQKKSKKVYRVTTGMIEKNEEKQLVDMENWTSVRIIAEDAEAAIKKVKPSMRKNEYIQEVELITSLDEL